MRRMKTLPSITASGAGRTRTSREGPGTRSSCGRSLGRLAISRVQRVIPPWRPVCCWCSTSPGEARSSACRCGWSRRSPRGPSARHTARCRAAHTHPNDRRWRRRVPVCRESSLATRPTASRRWVLPGPCASPHAPSMHAGTRTPPASLRLCAERRDCRQRIAPHPLPLQVAAAEALAFAQKHNCKYFEAVALSNEQARRLPRRSGERRRPNEPPTPRPPTMAGVGGVFVAHRTHSSPDPEPAGAEPASAQTDQDREAACREQVLQGGPVRPAHRVTRGACHGTLLFSFMEALMF